MPSVVATIKVKEEKVEEAKRFLKQLAADTLAKEKGTLAYSPLQRKDDPTTFVIYEKYATDEDLKLHTKNLAGVGAQFGALIASGTPPQIVFLEEI
jgi:quinol monooxygenase YgiN